MNSIIALFAVLGFVSVANAQDHKAAPAAAEHAAAPAAAVAPEHKMEEHADHAKKAPKKDKKAHTEEMKKEEAPKAEEAHH